MNISNVIWIDENIDNEENTQHVKELKSFPSLKVREFKEIDETINYMKSIGFEETKVIINDTLYSSFIIKFKENIKDMIAAPKIIVFAKDKENFIKNDKEFQKNTNAFYKYGGTATTFDEIKIFLQLIEPNEVQLTFEYIDKKEKLYLPLFFKALIDNLSIDNMEEYTRTLYKDYSDNKDISNLLEIIKSMTNIPIEILSKYYARLYTFESQFYKDMNKDLELNKTKKYLPFIKTLYEGVKLKSLPLATDNILYRGSKISNIEVKKIDSFLKENKSNLPKLIGFSNSFLSFSKDKYVAEHFFMQKKVNKNYSKVLYILEKDDTLGYSLATHGDIEDISQIKEEREVLFFPFSSFEIKEIKDAFIGEEKGYEIILLYLGKCLRKLENEINITLEEIKIPDDSEFKKQICKFGLIKPEKMENLNAKTLYTEFKKYEKEINENKIIGEIIIYPNDVYRDIQIINSFENLKRIWGLNDKEDDWKYENEKEIKESIEIKINRQKIDFSYLYRFNNEGIYKIEYIFKKNLTNTNYLFIYCNSLTNLNLSKFNTENVTNMHCMFSNCNSLTNLNLSNFKTQNVTDMSYMFDGCNSLTNLDLSNFNAQNVTNFSNMFNNCNILINLNLTDFKTQNATNMSNMFSNCKSLTNLDLSNFNTENVINMNNMFDGCNSLRNLNLSNFNTQNVSDFKRMFYCCNSLNNLNLSSFKTQNVTNMNEMFAYCKLLINLNLSSFNTENVKDMSFMFHNCNSLTNLDLSNFKTQNVNHMQCMFSNCNSLSNLNISNFNTQNVIYMNGMFHDCNSLANLNLSNFITQNVKDMNSMFSNCKSLTSLDLSNFNTQNVTNMNCMFYHCYSLTNLNLSNFKTQNTANTSGMFIDCNSLKKENIITTDAKILKEF